jgi:hypothetical protein
MKPSKILHVALIGTAIVLGGCVHQEPQYTWTKASINSEGREYLIADGACKAEAYKAVPMAPYNQSNCVFMPRGFAHGACVGSETKRAKAMTETRDQIYQACMMSKGWERQPVK